MDDFQVGDIVKITDFYTVNYPHWNVADKKAVIVSAKRRVVISEHLSKDSKAVYQALYGIQKEFPLWELLIKIEEGTYVASQLGFNKITA